MSSGGKSHNRFGDRGEVLAFFMIVVLLSMVFVVLAASSGRIGCQGSVRHPVQDEPCEEQPPIECIANTIEQASSSQFEHYVYCACVTDDGLSKGYVAAIKRPLARQTLPWIPDHDSPH